VLLEPLPVRAGLVQLSVARPERVLPEPGVP